MKAVSQKCNVPIISVSESENTDTYTGNIIFWKKNINPIECNIKFNKKQSELIITHNSHIHSINIKWWVASAYIYAYSYVVNTFFTTKYQDLSCRSDNKYMENALNDNGTLNLSKNPLDWIMWNNFIQEISKNKFFKKIIPFIVENRWIFIKPHKILAQKNYFNTSTNGWLPLIKKSDEIHEGTFMLHDIFHFLFIDPLLIGEENEKEKMYI